MERYDVWSADATFTLENLFHDTHEILDLLPTAGDNARLKLISNDMSVLRAVTKQLQDAKITMMDARILFDHVIKYFSAIGLSSIKFDFRPYLGVAAAIIDAEISADFENAIVVKWSLSGSSSTAGLGFGLRGFEV